MFSSVFCDRIISSHHTEDAAATALLAEKPVDVNLSLVLTDADGVILSLARTSATRSLCSCDISVADFEEERSKAFVVRSDLEVIRSPVARLCEDKRAISRLKSRLKSEECFFSKRRFFGTRETISSTTALS